MKDFSADVIIIGHGLAGLVAAYEITRKGKKVLVVNQETEANMGGQAFWSFGGLFFINSPEQRRMGIKDSYELGYRDWMGTAKFDREEDHWPRKWAEAYVGFAAEEKYSYVKSLGINFFRWWAGQNAERFCRRPRQLSSAFSSRLGYRYRGGKTPCCESL